MPGASRYIFGIQKSPMMFGDWNDLTFVVTSSFRVSDKTTLRYLLVTWSKSYVPVCRKLLPLYLITCSYLNGRLVNPCPAREKSFSLQIVWHSSINCKLFARISCSALVFSIVHQCWPDPLEKWFKVVAQVYLIKIYE